MKHTLLLAALLIGSLSTRAQILTPVKWATSFARVDGSTFDLKFTAKLDDGWYIYSQFVEDGGPIPTSFAFQKGDHFQLVGKVRENSSHRKEGFDDIFGMDVVKFAKEVTFVQRIKVLKPGIPIAGELEYQVCDNAQCLPPSPEEFLFDLPTGTETPAAPGAAGGKAAATQEPDKAAAPPAGPSPAAQSAASDTWRDAGAPAEWNAEVRRLGGGEYELQLNARLDQGWYTYSMFLKGDGPVPTSIQFESPEGLELVGQATESGPKKVREQDETFGMELVKFKEQASFRQRFRPAGEDEPVSGYLEYMVCNSTSCLPPAPVPFRIDLKAMTVVLGDGQAAIPPAIGQAPAAGAAPEDALYAGIFPKPDLENPVGKCGESVSVDVNSSNWSIFVLGFLGGLLALLTPCVFPMVPLTVSFFTKSAVNRRKGITNATLYGLFIFLVYLILSIPFHLMDSINPDILNDISTNVWLNAAFFVIFLVFAFSFFGYYELTLPSSWTNKAAAAEGIGGVIGIFFMALTLALVSFSCTGPILGSLLAGALSSDGGAWQLTAGMSGFGLALALPFALFAAFPSWMGSLPKSGGWLNTVKVTLGFLELALAFKFLSNADLVKHWGVLKIELFLGLWILIFLGLALYLLGRIRFPHDSPIAGLSKGRLGLGLLSLVFTGYLVSGFFYDEEAGSYRPLKLLSGLAPPAGYSFFHPSDCPQNLNCFKDLSEGLAYARKTNKPIMLDFTGYACVNCRKMEEHVWPEQSVYNKLRNDFVLISLYTDDKRELPAEEQVMVTKVDGKQRQLRTYGNKWAHLQTVFFKTNSQPFYVLISADGELLNNPTGYTPDAQEYAKFLECGKEAFEYLSDNKGADKGVLKEIGMREDR